MIQPDALTHDTPWIWSPGIGTDVWAMFCACRDGDLDTVRRLLAKDPSLVRAHYEYRTPLSFAVRENRVEIAGFLLDHGAEPLALGDVLQMARDRDYPEMIALLERKLAALHGASAAGEPIAAAIRDQDLARVRRLLDQTPALVSAGDARSNQPIHWAVMTRQIPIMDELLARGADINAVRADGARPLQLTNGDYHFRGWRDVLASVMTSPEDVYRHLVARGAHVDLGMAAFTGDLARVRWLVDRDPASVNRVDAYNSYYAGCGAPLKNAVLGRSIEIVRFLLERGADPNVPEEGIAPHGHALYSAVAQRDLEMARLLLEHGAYPNPEVESSADAVSVAIRNGDLPMIALLASYGAVWTIPTTSERVTYEQVVATGLRRAMNVLAYFGDVATAEPLMAGNPWLADDPDALTQAAERGHDAFVRLLLQRQPNLATRVTIPHPRPMAAMLFERGMDPNRRTWLGGTPLHRFAREGNVEAAGPFLDHGADLHARDEEFRSTPLAWAAREGQTRMAEFLLRRGADARRPDDPSWATPRAWAVKRGHDEIVRLLDRAEAEGVRALAPQTRARYDALVRDLVDAFDRGDASALDRVVSYFRAERGIGWDRPAQDIRIARVRQAIRGRLRERPSSATTETTLSLDDARWLVARAEGYEDWPALAASVAGGA